MSFLAAHWLPLLVGVAVLVVALVVVAALAKKYTRPGRWQNVMTIFLRWLFVGVAFCVILAAILPLRHLEQAAFVPGGSGPDVIKSNIDELKWLLTILAGFAVITAIAQAAAAWFSALTYDKQAKAKLEEINTVLADFRARYPVFADVEEKRNQAHEVLVATLRRVFAQGDPHADPTEAVTWVENFYGQLEVQKRQLILSVESFASVDLHPPRRGSEVHNLKLFALFYHAKARFEKEIPNTATFADLERAEGYLLLAIRKSPSNFTLYNELGNLYVTMSEHSGKLPKTYPNYLKAAEKQFEESRDYRKNQQRAYYNLAYIYAKRDNFEKARDLLLEALKHNTWQKVPPPNSIAAYIHYNLGCYEARIIARSTSSSSRIGTTQAKSVLTHLKKASELGQIQTEFVDTDYTNGAEGDIRELYDRADPALRAELDDLRTALVREHTKKPQPTFPDTVAEALRMIWNSAKERF
jgi:tetratricopeptide (TPR) repeat protein